MVEVVKTEVAEKKVGKKGKKAKNAEVIETEENVVKVEEKKSEGGGNYKKDTKDESPSSSSEIVLRVFMHCEGCARKVRKCLKGFDGVEDVTTDCKTHKVVVKGGKADPLKVLDRLQKKTNRQVDLLSPIPKPATTANEEAKKPKKEKEPPKPVEKKQEQLKVITVVLKVHMHCEPCSLEIKRRIERMKEVMEAIPDLKNSQVTVRGIFEPSKLVEYIYKRTGKQATIVNQDPPPQSEKKKDNKAKDGKAEKKGENGDDSDKNKNEKKKGEEKGEAAKVKEVKEVKIGDVGKAVAGEGVHETVELNRSEYQYYPPRYVMEMNAYPPQIFSDENPNACSIM